MSASKLVIINILLGLLVVVFFLRKRKLDAPSKLNLKTKSSNAHAPSSQCEHLDLGHSQSETFDDATFTGTFVGKDLNVIFNFNGHSFDAYEILGLPAGSAMSQVREAFDKAKQHGPAADSELLEAALVAIQQKQGGTKA